MAEVDGHSRRIGGALVQMLGARLISLFAMMVGFVVLARLLTPQDFGVYALALAGYGVMQVLADFGLREYMLREPRKVPAQDISFAAAISFGLALVGAGILLLLPLVLPDGWVPSGFRTVVGPMALALLIEPLILQREVSLHRDLRFHAPARAAVSGVCAEVVLGITLAVVGFGALALAMGLLGGQVARAATLLLLSDGARPVRPSSGKQREMVRFGTRLTWVRALPKLADMVMIATLTGAAGTGATGLYNRAQRVRGLLDETIFFGIRPVILPAFTSALQNGLQPAEMVAAKTCRLLVVVVPAFIGIALLAEPLVALLLGPDWLDAVPLVQILALGGLAGPVTMMSLKVFTVLDEVDTYGRIQLIALCARLIAGTAAAFVSLPLFCVAIAGSMWLKAFLIMRWHWHHIAFGENLRGLRIGSAAVVTAGAAAGPSLLYGLTNLGPALLIGLSLVTAILGWLLALRGTDHPLWSDMNLMLADKRAVV